ncbi:MAG: hypothetical protein HW421_910 [Ignavibacteria bacterium]|nr:hypothetical protein [Ignavibacteria bacterium]
MIETFHQRSKENLKAAEMLFENGLYNASANRAYYAAFHIALVAVYQSGYEPKIDHKALNSIFSDLFINRRKILPSKYKSYLYEMQSIRNFTDYGSGVNKKKSKENLEKAKEFIEILTGVMT